MTSKFDKNELFSVKGRLGELIYSSFVGKSFDWVCEENDELQKVGVDFIVKNRQNVELRKIDVKLTDSNAEYFSIAYSKPSTGLRHPFRNGCKADRLAIVSFAYEKYMEDHYQQLEQQVSNEEQAIVKLSEYVDGKDLEKLVDSLKKREKRDTYSDLCDLIIVHRACESLEKQYNNNTYDFLDSLIKKQYITSIDEIPVGMIINLLKGFESFGDGAQVFDKNKNFLFAKKNKWTRYGLYTAAEIGWNAVNSEKLFLLQDNTILDNPALQKVWFYAYSNKIAISEQGNTLNQMSKDSLMWIQNENKSKRSSFFKVFGLSCREELDSLIENLIKKGCYKQVNS